MFGAQDRSDIRPPLTQVVSNSLSRKSPVSAHASVIRSPHSVWRREAKNDGRRAKLSPPAVIHRIDVDEKGRRSSTILQKMMQKKER